VIRISFENLEDLDGALVLGIVLTEDIEFLDESLEFGCDGE
jgi:hypothetical protein